MIIIDLFSNVINYVDAKTNRKIDFEGKLNHHLLYIIKNWMQMNNDHIYRDLLNLFDDMIDDDHVLKLMLKDVDNQYNKKVEIWDLIDVQ